MLERIAVNPKIHFGKPCIAGTRIQVQSVLELLNEDLSFEEIIQDYYPDIIFSKRPSTITDGSTSKISCRNEDGSDLKR